MQGNGGYAQRGSGIRARNRSRRGRAEEHMLSMLSFASSLKDKLGFTNQQIRDALSISNEDWALIADKL